MRLYAPAKPSTSTGEEDGRRQQQHQNSSSSSSSNSSFQHEDNNNNNNTTNNNNSSKNYHQYDSRAAELTRRSLENDPRLDDKLHLTAPATSRLDDTNNKAQPNHTPRLDDKILSNGPKAPHADDQRSSPASVVDSVISMKRSPSSTTVTTPMTTSAATATSSTTTTTTTTTTQNGPSSLDYSSPPHLENGTDSLRSLDSIPWNLEGTETIIKNGSKPTIKNGSITTEEDELKKLREENKKLKAALEEAAEVNGQWRQYHDERQGYVQRLLTTIHELQHSHSSTAPSPRQLDGEGGSGGQEAEVRRLREALTRLQADHREHVQLLEMQVRAHRDDWEAERSEKRSAEAALAETEARAALLLQELQLLQAKLADSESKRGLCWRCVCPRNDYNNHCRSGSNSAPRTPQASPIPAPGGGASPAPVVPSAPPPDNPPVPLKGWIPVSMLHQIAFSGATPEHQTPVVQSQPHPQQPNRNYTPVQPQNLQNQQQQMHQSQPVQQHQQQQSKAHNQQSQHQQPNQVKQQTLQVHQQPRHQQAHQQKQSAINCMPKPAPIASSTNNKGTEFMQNNRSHENAVMKVANVINIAEDKKRYEAMGARPKILGDLHSVTGKGIGIIEDEKSAKHRARSILASAIPVSPVSSGPSTPCGVSVSRGAPNMPKGYMPITSTVLTPINFRPPFVAHKRPSAIKHTGQTSKGSSQAPSVGIGVITPATHVRSESSPASLYAGNNADANATKNLAANPVKKETSDLSKNSDKNEKSNLSTNNQSVSQSKKSPSPNTKKKQANNSTNASSSKEQEKSPSSLNKAKTSECADVISIVTTTISCSSPSTVTTTSSSSVSRTGYNQVSRGPNTGAPEILSTVSSNITAFASINVTTTTTNNPNSNNTTSTYSSTTSSRSSSPGISLTTFGLNSEGRGIPGAICFALGSDQKGTRSPQQCMSPRRTSNASVMSPTPDILTAGQSQKDIRTPTGVNSPTIIINNAPPTTIKEEHWWSVESPGRNKQQSSQSGKLVNSTWVRLMGSHANNRPGSGLPWRTARAVSGQHLNQARKLSNEEVSNGTTSPCSVSSSTATFNYTPAVNSPPSSNLSSATNSASSSPPPNPNQPQNDLKSMASKNISSAILSYELSAKCEPVATTTTDTKSIQTWSGKIDNSMNDGVATMTRKDLVCPSCQMLFPPEKHLEFLDHFEVCRGPEYADL